ncbi:hypothetical protein EVA_09816, partial [gut metagenome]
MGSFVQKEGACVLQSLNKLFSELVWLTQLGFSLLTP